MMQRKSLLILFYLLHLNNYQAESQTSITIPNYWSPQFTENNALKQVSLDFQAEYFDYLVKILPNRKQQLQQCSIKKISSSFWTTLTTTTNLTLELHQNDLLKCEIVNRINEKSPILEMHTSSTTSGTNDVSKFLNPRKGNCFSFRVKSKFVAEIYLYNKLFEWNNGTMVSAKHAIVTLGDNDNTISNMRVRYGFCKNCDGNVSTPNILNSENFNGFWISWNKTQISVGKENEEKELFSKILDIGDIQYIGLSTPGTSDHGVWHIMEPFCPLNKTDKDQSNTERTFFTKCHKIFDKTILNSLDISAENKLLKKIEALISEFNTEVPVSVNKIKDYYFKSLDELYLKEYMHLLKKCKNAYCDETTINMIQEKFDNFRKTLQNKLKNLISNLSCSINEHYDDRYEQCLCNSGFTKNGNYCEKDTYKSNGNVKINSYSNDKPKLLVDELKKPPYKPSILKTNETKYVFYPIESTTKVNYPRESTTKVYYSRESTTKVYYPRESTTKVPSSSSREMSSTESTYLFQNAKKVKACKDDYENLNCVKNFILPTDIKKKNCTLGRDFSVLYHHNLTRLELVFFLNDSDYIYKLTWNNMEYPTFKLNELKHLTEVAENEKNVHSNALWINNSAKRFKRTNYRLFIKYGIYKINIRIEDNGVDNNLKTIIDSGSISAHKIKYDTIINKLCLTTNAIQWDPNEGIHDCV